MQRYKNLGGNSGVVAFEVTDISINVQFDDGMNYLYNYQSTGATDIEAMKKLAISGVGLNSFINKHVKARFVSKRLQALLVA
jgi:hypothetical protein